MEIAVVIAFALAAVWLVQWLVEQFGGESAVRPDFWTAFGVIFASKYIARFAVMPFSLELYPRVAVSMAVYIAAIAIFLHLACTIPVLRALAISLAIAVVLFARTLFLVAGIG